MKKILAICGSPRKGNTEFMLNKILENIHGNKELVLLRNSKINHCEGSLSCEKLKDCIIKDDIQDLYKKMENADLIILGSPCYWFSVTGLFKDFIDRCTPYYYNKILKNKKVFLISVGEDESKKCGRDTIKLLKLFCKELGMKIMGSYIAIGKKSDDIFKNKKVNLDLEEIGRNL